MLPRLQTGLQDYERVRVDLRILNRTAKALRVAEPFLGPDQCAGRTAWLPASAVTVGDASGLAFRCFTVTLPIWLYRRLQSDLA